MNETNDFLKFLINEEIYVIDSQESKVQGIATVVDEPSAIKEEDVSADNEVVAPVAPTTPMREILVLFDNPIAKDLVAGELEYLGKILGAIGQSVDRVNFHNIATKPAKVEGYKFVLVFTPNHQLPVPASTMQYTAVMLNDSQLIIADALSNIAQSTDLRKKLWVVLQEVFK